MADNLSRLRRLTATGLFACVLCGPAIAERITIVATVNDDIITSTDLSERRSLVMNASDIPNTPENVQRVTPRVLQSLIDESLQMQEAKRSAITISDAELDKTLDNMGETKTGAPGSLRKAIVAKGLSLRSLQNQIRATLAWNKVVQRKLRRNVTISRDELLRAQQAQASDPGVEESRVTALILPITAADKVEKMQKMAGDISASLKSGQDLAVVGSRYVASGDAQVTPPVWVNEENLPPELAKTLQTLKAGETSNPIRIGNSVQFVKLLEKRVTKKPSISTEVLIKQISVDVPAKPTKDILVKLNDTEQLIRNNPGSCEDTTMVPTKMPLDVKFARLKMGDLPGEQRSTIARLGVGDLSEPLVAPGKMRLVLLCERVDMSGSTADMEGLRQQLFGEKIELEAQKHLRNLRRDATIDIRSDQ